MSINEAIAEAIKNYDCGYSSLQDLYMQLLQVAENTSDVDSVVLSVPSEHLGGFARHVEEYVSSRATVSIGPVSVERPSHQTVAKLHAALGRRREMRS